VSSSRWESFSLASHEALTQGASVAGPRLEPLEGVVSSGPFGTLAERRTADGLAAALIAEADAWERGERDAAAIAQHWRERLDLEHVAARFAELLDAVPVGRGA
jgi:hypothetical protein